VTSSRRISYTDKTWQVIANILTYSAFIIGEAIDTRLNEGKLHLFPPKTTTELSSLCNLLNCLCHLYGEGEEEWWWWRRRRKEARKKSSIFSFS
jgi:hypothetical protein